MNINDVKIIGVGKDEHSDHLNGMIEGKILPWVADSSENSYPVWEIFGATQRSTYFLNRAENFMKQILHLLIQKTLQIMKHLLT